MVRLASCASRALGHCWDRLRGWRSFGDEFLRLRMETGRVRLEGTGSEILDNPEMGALYLGGTIEERQASEQDPTEETLK